MSAPHPANDAVEANEIAPEQLRTSLNLFSTMLAANLGQLTCSVHESCDGSCSGGPPITFEPLIIGTQLFQLSSGPNPSPHPPSHAPSEHISSLFIQTFPPFQYNPINSTEPYIRLLRVHPAVYLETPIMAEIEEVSLDKCPQFAALSYHWGPPVFDHAIICNAQRLPVTASLHNALRRHRQDKSNEVEWIWADAVCINQSNKSELNAQLPLMSRIYQQAQVVYVDLGDIQLGWYTGFDLMRRVQFVASQVETTQSAIPISEFETYGLPEVAHVAWRAFSHLFSAKWFWRTWVIQEVALAKKLTVRFGRFVFEWDDLVKPLMFLGGHNVFHVPSDHPHIMQAKLNMLRIIDIRRYFQAGQICPVQLLRYTRDFLVSDNKDKIIGVLGLLSSIDPELSFHPDYTWSLARLYHRFAIYLVQIRKAWGSWERVDMLAHAGLHRRSPSLMTDLPSWVPDWTAQSLVTGPKAFATIRQNPFAATPPLAPAMVLQGLEEEPQILIIAGQVLDTIEQVTVEFWLAEMETGSQSSAKFLKWHAEVEGQFQNRQKEGRLAYEDPDDAFSRTLLADDLYDTPTAKPSYLKGGFSQIQDSVNTHAAAVELIRSGKQSVSSMGALDGVETYICQAQAACMHRRFAITEKGYICLVPNCAKVGDSVCIFSGVSTPFVLRSTEAKTLLVGDAYVHGIMYGEALNGVKTEDFPWEAIAIH